MDFSHRLNSCWRKTAKREAALEHDYSCLMKQTGAKELRGDTSSDSAGDTGPGGFCAAAPTVVSGV